MQFIIDERKIECENEWLIGDNADYTAQFTFDAEWDGLTKTARFQTNKRYVDVILEDDACTIPVEILKQGIIEVGVYTDTFATTPCEVKVKASIKQCSGNIAEPNEDVYGQLIKKLNVLEIGTVSDERVAEAVSTFVSTDTTLVKTAEFDEMVNDYLVKQNIPTDIANAKADIIKNAHESAGAIICNASGSVVSVADASDREFESITLYGKSTQDGTPSIDAPVDIVSVGDDGNVGVAVSGRNLIDYEQWKQTTVIKGTGEWKDNGVVITSTEDGDAFTQFQAGGNTLKIPVKYGKTYTLSWEHSGSNGIIYIFPNGTSENNIKIGTDKANQISYTVTEKEVTFITFRVGVYPANSTAIFKNVMLNIGSEALPFEQYVGEQTASIDLSEPLRGLPVTSGGNYTDADGQQWLCDTLEVFADGTGKLTQRVYGGLLDGTLHINELSVHTGVKETVSNFRTSAKGLKKGGQIKSTHLTKTNIWSPDIEGIQIIEADAVDYTIAYEKIGVTAEATSAERVTACKAFLKENPITFVAEIHTPIETELTTEQVQAILALHSYKPNTVITTDDMGDIAVEYIADSKTYIDNKFTELANAIIASGATE